MLLIFIIFTAIYILSYTKVFKKYVDEDNMLYTSCATFLIAIVINIVNFYIKYDDAYHKEATITQCDITKKDSVFFEIDGRNYNISKNKILKFKTDTTNQFKAFKYEHKADSTLSILWTLNLYEDKLDSIVVYNYKP